MTWILIALGSWAALSLLGLVAASAVCRSGHLEDVARGFSHDVPLDPYVGDAVPGQSASPDASLNPRVRS